MTMDNATAAVSVHRSATRRKACTCCIVTKRRCDLTLPKCTRCRTRNLACVYAEHTPSKKILPEQKKTSASTFNSSAEPLNLELERSNAWDTDFSSMFEIDPACLIDPQIDIPNKTSTSTALNTSISTFQFPDYAALSARQTLYIITQFKSYLRSFVIENQTSFIHPSLYQSTFPPTYQDVLGICSLYNHKTSSNQSTIFRMLDSKIAILIQTSDSLLYNLEGNLLALQALILYQLIRLFDGDPRQRSNGERHLELLDSWTLRIQQNLNDTFNTTVVCEGGYRQWVLEESVRRTTMMSVVLRSLYGFMKFGFCELIPLLATLPVSKNSKLWKSPELIVKVNGKENGLSSYWDFTMEWNMGNVVFGEVDEYEKLLLVACRHAFGTDDFQPV